MLFEANDVLGHSESYKQHRERLARDYRDAQADKALILSWLELAFNWAGSIFVRWGNRLLARDLERQSHSVSNADGVQSIPR